MEKKFKKTISQSKVRRYLAMLLAVITVITAIPLSNITLAKAGIKDKTFYFTFNPSGSDSYIADTWVFWDGDLTAIAEQEGYSSVCQSAWLLIATWETAKDNFSESGDITWTKLSNNYYMADGDFYNATPFIRIIIDTPSGYHLKSVRDNNNSKMAYYYDGGNTVVAECGLYVGDWTEVGNVENRDDKSTSNITLEWERDTYSMTMSWDSGVDYVTVNNYSSDYNYTTAGQSHDFGTGDTITTNVHLKSGYDIIGFQEDAVSPGFIWTDWWKDDNYPGIAFGSWSMSSNRSTKVLTNTTFTAEFDDGFENVDYSKTIQTDTTQKDYIKLKDGYVFDYVEDNDGNKWYAYDGSDSNGNYCSWKVSKPRNVTYHSKVSKEEYTVRLHPGSIDSSEWTKLEYDDGWTWNSSGQYFYKTFYKGLTGNVSNYLPGVHKFYNSDNYEAVGNIKSKWFVQNASTSELNDWWTSGTDGTRIGRGEKSYNNLAEIAKSNGGVVDLYPHWVGKTTTYRYTNTSSLEASSSTITINNNINGGTDNYLYQIYGECFGYKGTDGQYHEYTGTNPDLKVTAATSEKGYKFVGWAHSRWINGPWIETPYGNEISEGYLTNGLGKIILQNDFKIGVGETGYYLTPRFKPIEYTVRLNANVPAGCTSTVEALSNSAAYKYDTTGVYYYRTLKYNASQDMISPNGAFSLKGYHLDTTSEGTWYKNADGSGDTVTASCDAPFDSYPDWAENKWNLTETDGDTVNLYAKWTANKYNITYNLNGGTHGSSHPASATYDKAFTVSNPTRTGYEFTGWTITGTDNSTKVINGTSYKNLTPVDGATVTFTANWNRLDFNVSFSPNGGTGSMNAVTATYGLPFTIPASSFSRYGYTQTGWTTKSDGTGDAYNLGQTINPFSYRNDLTLYAKWQINRHNIKVYIQHENADGTWGTPQLWINETKNYNESYHYDGYGSDSTGPDNAVYKNICVTGTMPDADMSKTVKAYRRTYTQKLTVYYENADGTWSAGQTVINEAYKYGQTVSWSRNADARYEAANISWTVEGNNSKDIYVHRRQYKLTVNGNAHITGTQGSGTYRYEFTQWIEAQIEVGYHFLNWNGDSSLTQNGMNVTVTGNATYTANAAPNTDTPYTVEHYQMNLDGTTYTLAETDKLKGTTDTTVYPDTKKYTGFTSPGKQALVIKGDGTAILKYYYTRNKYIIKYVPGVTNNNAGQQKTQEVFYNADVTTISNPYTGTNYSYTFSQGFTSSTDRAWDKITSAFPGNVSGTLPFSNWLISGKTYAQNALITKPDFSAVNGAVIEAKAQWSNKQVVLPSVTRPGYNFTGWYSSRDNRIYAAGTNYTIAPATERFSTNFEAKWTARTDTRYTVYHYKMNLDGSSYDLAETDYLTGTTDTKVTPNVKSYTGFTSPGTQTVNINGDGSTVVKYYYSRNKYTLNLDGLINGVSRDSLEEVVDGNKYTAATASVYINDVVKADGVSDYVNTDVYFGSSYRIVTTAQAGYTVVNNTGVISGKMPASDLSVIPEVIPNTYEITFDTNRPANASNSPVISKTSMKAVYNRKVGEMPQPVLVGWTFDGWYTKKDGGTQIVSDSVYNWTADKTVLYAHWTPNTYTVEFYSYKEALNLNSGTLERKPERASGTMTDICNLSGIRKVRNNVYAATYTYDTESLLPAVQDMYSLIGWTAGEWSFGTNKLTSSYRKWNLTSINGATVKIYGTWSENEYTIKYDSTGGTGKSDIIVKYEDEIALESAPFRPGFKFVEWNTKKDGTGRSYQEKVPVKNLISENNGVFTIYSIWEKCKPTTVGTITRTSTNAVYSFGKPITTNDTAIRTYIIDADGKITRQ